MSWAGAVGSTSSMGRPAPASAAQGPPMSFTGPGGGRVSRVMAEHAVEAGLRREAMDWWEQGRGWRQGIVGRG